MISLRREAEASCPRCSGEIQKITFSGRSACFCPSCQRA
ncbi:MAG: hypothetical protein DRP87_00300 [Spirochaetes bacterium]|nr:MAG: hypothetical protein DRP87_00300 [Spirochaetota bacterium]